MNDRSKYIRIACAAILPNIGGFIKSSSHQPPYWVCSPLWTGLYSASGFASYLVWRDGGGFSGDAKGPLILFGSQLALNWAWEPILHNKHNVKAAKIKIMLLTAIAGMTGYAFHNINVVAGYMFIPYVAWLTLASFLTNGDNDSDDKNKFLEERQIADEIEGIYIENQLLGYLRTEDTRAVTGRKPKTGKNRF